ncbi:MAG: hypothetical protein JO080_12485 [Mucilaginibacter sp.]|nr:hypothetical protein [Mucilaginibacter sp.]
MNRLINISKDRYLRTLLLIVLCCIIVYIISEILYKVLCGGNFDNSEIAFFITSIKDTFQILIFLIVGVITILSYLQASKTLFTPIKTEIFKIQIKAFEEILIFFQSKSETDFTAQFDFDFIVQANSRMMISDFIEHFYKNEITVDKEKLNELRNNFAGAIATHTWAVKNFSSPEYFEKTEVDVPEEVTNPAIILENWKNYEYGPINLSRKFSEQRDKLNQLIASPLIPIELRNKIQSFDGIIHENLLIVGKVLNDIAQELPQKFPTAKSLAKFEPIGIWNRYNDQKKDVEDTANEILTYIRKYLKIDKLVD